VGEEPGNEVPGEAEGGKAGTERDTEPVLEASGDFARLAERAFNRE
jgi:hypothetical protein